MYALSDNDPAAEYDEQALAELIYRNKDQMPIEIFRLNIAKPVPIENLLIQYGPRLEAAEEDTVPKPDVKPIAEYGDIYELGPHRLVCGDATEEWAYKALMGEEKADMVFTDPPYNVNYEGDKFSKIMNDDMDPELFIKFTELFMQRLKDATKPGGVLYICSGYSSYPPFVYCMQKIGLYYSGPIIWVKNQSSMGFEDYKKKHEMVLQAKKKAKKALPILYGWNGGRHYFASDKFEADVWEMARRASTTMLHPTQKPLALVQRALRNSSRTKESVLDPFAGSGSTLVAAEREGRVARVMELDPIYVDTIIRRYAALGGPNEHEIRETKKKAAIPKKKEEGK